MVYRSVQDPVATRSSLITLSQMSGRLPDQPVPWPVNQQQWANLAFLHWRYDVAVVQALVPRGLTVQEWDGVTWVGITPFRMLNVRAPMLPPPPGWAEFPELNVRAYVRGPDGRDGIWFFALAVSRPSFVGAMRILGLPYERSHADIDVDGSRWTYRFDPIGPARAMAGEGFSAVVDVGEDICDRERTPLVDSLTGRWSGYHRRGGLLWRTPIAHEPWPLRTAVADGDLTGPLLRAGLPAPEEPPLVHAASVVSTSLGPPRPVALSNGRLPRNDRRSR